MPSVMLDIKFQLLSRMEEIKFTVPLNMFMTMWYTKFSSMCEELQFCTVFQGRIEGLIKSMWQQPYRARWRLQSTISVSIRTGCSEAYSAMPIVVN